MFINRHEEIEFLRSEQLKHSNESCFLLLSAPSGVGKSSLVDYAFKQEFASRFIRVKVAKHAGSQNIPWLHVRELGRSINQFAGSQGHIPTFKQHYRQAHRKKGMKTLFTAIAADFVRKKTDSTEAAEWISSWGQRENEDLIVNAILSSEHAVAHTEVVTYIKDVLGGRDFIIAVENVQGIDRDSMVFLKDLLTFNRGLCIVGEYTEDDNAQIGGFELADYFASPPVRVEVRKIAKLRLEDIINECEGYPDMVVAILRDSYEKSTGNLHHLRILMSDDFSRTITREVTAPQYDTVISRALESLSLSDMVVVSAVVTHRGCVGLDLLQLFMRQDLVLQGLPHDLFSLEQSLARLAQRNILIATRDEVTASQDSIIDAVVSADWYNKYCLICRKAWLTLYQELKSHPNDFFLSRSELIAWEIYFRALLADLTGLSRLIEEIYSLTLLSSAPRRAIKHLKDLRQQLVGNPGFNRSGQVFRILDLGIMRILYRLGYFEEIPLFSSAHLDDTLGFLLHVSSLCLIGRQDESIALCNKSIDDSNEHRRWGALLVRLAAYRASNRYEDCEEEWFRLHRTSTFKGTKYEAMFLRSADFALSAHCEDLFRHLHASIAMYEATKDSLQEISARNALAQHLGYEGCLVEAEAQLRAATEKARTIYGRYYVLENNWGVLALQRKSADAGLLERFQKAAMLCDTELDRLIIWNNLLITQSMLRQTAEAEQTLRALEGILSRSNNLDYELQRIVLFNGYVHYDKTGEVAAAQLYRERARALPTVSDHAFWNQKLNGQSDPAPSDFRLTLDYYPVYITHWHFDFDSVLSSSQ